MIPGARPLTTALAAQGTLGTLACVARGGESIGGDPTQTADCDMWRSHERRDLGLGRVTGLGVSSRRAFGEIDPRFANVHLTYADIFGCAPDHEQVTADTARVPLASALYALGCISCVTERRDGFTREGQLHLVRRLALPAAVTRALSDLLSPEPLRPLLSPQHLAGALRRALELCDPAAHEAPADVDVRLSMLQLLLSSAEDADPDVASGDADRLISYFLRQSGIASRRVLLYAITDQAERLSTAWADRHGEPSARNLDEEFRNRTGLSIVQHLRAAYALHARFAAYAEEPTEPAAAAVDPIDYLQRVGIPTAAARRFVDRYSATPADLQQLATDEVRQYGPTTFRSTTFDRKPLVRFPNGAVMPTSFPALERLVHEGTYWACRPPDREQSFTSQYGQVTERLIQSTIERIARADPQPPVFARDITYGPKRARMLASDANLRYPADWVAFEIVTGRASVPTITRGDLRAFTADVNRLVIKKARQLARCQNDAAFYGRLKLGPDQRPERFWPVIVLADGFPTMPPLYGAIVQMVSAQVRLLPGHPTLTLIDADDLAALERLGEHGHRLIDVLRRWKRQAPFTPLANWLRFHPSFPDGLGLASHHQKIFDDLISPWVQELES